MFEIAGIDNKKREPTSMERVKLKENMESFCTKYPVIKDKLKDKGIILTRESLMPPEERYAKIIDISKRNVVCSSSNKRRRVGQKLKAINGEE